MGNPHSLGHQLSVNNTCLCDMLMIFGVVMVILGALPIELGYGYVVRGHDGLRDLSFGDQDEMVSPEAGETIGKLGGGGKSQDPLEFLQLYPFLNDGSIQNGHTKPSRLIYSLRNINQENRPEMPSQNLMICFGSRTLKDEGPSFLLVKGSVNDFLPNCIPWEKLKTNVDQRTSSSTTQSERGKRSVQCMERCMEHSSLHPAQCNSLCWKIRYP